MTDEEIETARALGIGMRRGAEEGTLEDIAWREAYKEADRVRHTKEAYKNVTENKLASVRRAYYEGFIAGFTHKFKGEVNETN